MVVVLRCICENVEICPVLPHGCCHRPRLAPRSSRPGESRRQPPDDDPVEQGLAYACAWPKLPPIVIPAVGIGRIFSPAQGRCAFYKILGCHLLSCEADGVIDVKIKCVKKNPRSSGASYGWLRSQRRASPSPRAPQIRRVLPCPPPDFTV